MLATLLSVATLVAVAQPGAPAGAQPADAPGNVEVTSVGPSTEAAVTATESADYASQAWADPWDFANPEDLRLVPITPSEGGGVTNVPGVSNPVMANGLFEGDFATGAKLELGSTQNNALNHGRDTSLKPIKAGQYTRISFRMYSPVGFNYGNGDGAAGVSWATCKTGTPDCEGFFPIITQAGWHTYDYDIAASASGGLKPWAGDIYQIRILRPSGAPASVHLAFDYVRLYTPTQPAGVNVTIPANATSVWWDADTNPTGEGPWEDKLADAVPAGGSVNVPTDRFAPGTYRIYYKQGGSATYLPDPVVVNARPRPVVIDPDLAGGDDYATVVRGDAWDFDQPSDAQWPSNITYFVASGLLQAFSAGPNKADPQIYVPMAGTGTLDANTYHRLTFTVGYGGTFGQGGGPGGGMVARLIWLLPVNGVTYQDSNDMVVFPGEQTISVDLAGTQALDDELPLLGRPSIGWGGPAPTVIGVRFDAHEDPGDRTWYLKDLRIARNDRGTPTFDIRFRDDAWEPGTTADLYADTDANPANGGRTLIADDVPVGAGENTYSWNLGTAAGGQLPQGTYHISADLTDPGGATGGGYSTGPVDMPTQPVPPPSAPTGVTAVGGVEQATVSWTPPASGAPLSSYRVTPSTGSGYLTVSPGQTSTVITGLAAGSTTFTVTAVNAGGPGPPSASSNAVTVTARPGTRFHPVAPYRAYDSRSIARLGPAEIRPVPLAPSGGVDGVPADASAVVANVTVTGGTAGSYLSLFPGNAVPPTTANLNFSPGQTVPNAVTVGVGADGTVSLFNALGQVDVIIDIVGYFDADGTGMDGAGFEGVTPERILDSRDGTGVEGYATPWGASSTRAVTVAAPGATVPDTATAIVANVTVTGPTKASYLRLSPTGSLAGTTANLLFAPGQTVPNLVVVAVGDGGQVDVYNQLGSTHVIIDVLGYFDPAGGGLFHPVNPTRLLDSRNGTGGGGGKWTPNHNRSLAVAGASTIPVGATGVVMNVTVVQPSSVTYVSASPTPGTVPAPTANLLAGPGQIVPNLTMVGLPTAGGGTGKVDLYNQLGQVDLVGDAAGYFATT